MQITLGQLYNVGEKPTVILYIYINRHAGTPEKHYTLQTVEAVVRTQKHHLDADKSPLLLFFCEEKSQFV